MATERAALFGDDLQIVERAGGLDLIGDPQGDLTLAHGNDNIAQALLLRLRVRKGELTRLGWADFGSRVHELLGEPNNTRTHVKLMAFARAAVEQDARVLSVESVAINVIPGERDVARVSMEVKLINEPDPLNLVFAVKLA